MGSASATDAFFTLYEGLDRKGPGEAADVAWVADVIGLAPDARICDAGCGSGDDVAALLRAAPAAAVTAIDCHKPFIDELRDRVGEDKRVTAVAGDMAKLEGPCDLIWCAGALYFLGVTEGLKTWRSALAKGGAVAFSEPCLFTESPSEAALAFWEGYSVTDASGIDERVRAAKYQTIATRRISDAAWQAYYQPLGERIALLRPTADETMSAVLDTSQTEIDEYRRVRDETGYLLCVVRPLGFE